MPRGPGKGFQWYWMYMVLTDGSLTRLKQPVTKNCPRIVVRKSDHLQHTFDMTEMYKHILTPEEKKPQAIKFWKPYMLNKPADRRKEKKIEEVDEFEDIYK